MEYQIVIRKNTKTKGDETILVESYPTKSAAEDKIKESYSKYQTEVVAIPEIKLGLNLYRKNNPLVTILAQSKCLYFYNDIHNLSAIDKPIRKEVIKMWFVNGYLDQGIEDYLPDYDGVYKVIDNIEDDEDIKETDE